MKSMANQASPICFTQILPICPGQLCTSPPLLSGSDGRRCVFAKPSFVTSVLSKSNQGNQWWSVFFVFYPMEFLITSFALLLVLDRLTKFILPPQSVLFQRRLKVMPLIKGIQCSHSWWWHRYLRDQLSHWFLEAMWPE